MLDQLNEKEKIVETYEAEIIKLKLETQQNNTIKANLLEEIKQKEAQNLIFMTELKLKDKKIESCNKEYKELEKNISEINGKIVQLNDESDNKIKEIANLKCLNDKKHKIIIEVRIILSN